MGKLRYKQMENRSTVYAKIMATSKVFGVACLLLGGMAEYKAYAQVTTTATESKIMEKELPPYLVGDADVIKDERILELQRQGKLSEAIRLLNMQDSKEARAEVFRLEKLKREFSVTRDEVLAKVQERIPDATMADIERWTADNSIYWMPVDGKIGYFRREPGILTRFNAEAKKRAKPMRGSTDEENNILDHFAEAVKTAKDTGTSVVLPVRFTVKHTVRVKPGSVPAGETVRCWMPYPRADVLQQTDIDLVSMKPEGRISADEDSPQRTAYMEQKAAPDGSAVFELNYKYTFAALVPDLDKPDASLAQRPNSITYATRHINAGNPLDQEYKDLANRIVGKETDATQKARLIWRWLDENIRWCPEMEYVVMTDIASKVRIENRGDCGTQAIMFARLCAAVGVDARWQSGWTTQPGAWNMHDWAEFFAPGVGWCPADPSRGSQNSDDPAVREFLFGHMDAYRMVANSDFNAEFVPAKEHHRSDPVDNQRGEVEWKGGNLYYDAWSYEVDVKSEPIKGSARN